MCNDQRSWEGGLLRCTPNGTGAAFSLHVPWHGMTCRGACRRRLRGMQRALAVPEARNGRRCLRQTGLFIHLQDWPSSHRGLRRGYTVGDYERTVPSAHASANARQKRKAAAARQVIHRCSVRTGHRWPDDRADALTLSGEHWKLRGRVSSCGRASPTPPVRPVLSFDGAEMPDTRPCIHALSARLCSVPSPAGDEYCARRQRDLRGTGP